eukprot:TRINITY_DN3711_c0_g1_i1.p1 TRINITY_DN3711_c0_g1~~TRINITY_DN3711_c0_g1_i1.p1  ORF type:complete len:637 (+),score=238.40 TRINITY_DN3711_c0_g1_i1:134-2044(+)
MESSELSVLSVFRLICSTSSIEIPLSLSHSLQETDDTHQLHLHDIALSPSLIAALSQAIEKAGSAIDEVHINECFLGDEGCATLCKAFETLKSLRQLDLKGNGIRGNGAVEIGRLLENSKTLRTVVLEWNQIGSEDHGIEAIGRGVSLSSSLEAIDLRNNRITPQSAVILAESFKSSHGLSRIDLRWNMLGNGGARAILEAARSNSRLMDVQVTGNNVSYEIQMEITRILERNKSLHGIDERERVLHRALQRDLDGMRVVKEEEILALQGKMMAKETIAGQYQKKLEEVITEREEMKSQFEQKEEEFEKKIRKMEEESLRMKEKVEHYKSLSTLTQTSLHQLEERFETETRALQEKLHDCDEERSSMDEQIRRYPVLVERQKTTERELQQLRKKNLQLSKERDALDHAKSLTDDECRTLRERISVLESTVASKEDAIRSFQTTMDASRKEQEKRLAQLQRALREERESSERVLRQRIEQIEAEKDDLQSTLDRKDEEVHQSMRAKSNAEEMLIHEQSQCAALRRETREQKMELDESRSRLVVLEREMDAMRTEMETKVRSAKEKHDAEVKRMHEHAALQREQVAALELECANLKDENVKLRQKQLVIVHQLESRIAEKIRDAFASVSFVDDDKEKK